MEEIKLRLLSEIEKMENRIQQLREYEDEYLKQYNPDSFATCYDKRKVLEMVVENLKKNVLQIK